MGKTKKNSKSLENEHDKNKKLRKKKQNEKPREKLKNRSK